MKIADHLNDDQKQKLNQINKRKKKKNKKLSAYELRDLMGQNRDTYERRGGAIRRK